MQKKIIALAVAALASGAAFAQTSVVIGGNIDMGYSAVDQEAKLDGKKTEKKSNGFSGNDSANWSSTQITIAVTEDLGNGLKAGFFNAIGLNPFVGGKQVDESYADGKNYAFGRNRDSYIYLNGKSWGQFAVGYKNTIESQLNGIGNAGSGNLGNIGRAFNSKITVGESKSTFAGWAESETGALTDTSRANVFEYASPVFSGFQAMGQYGTTTVEDTVTTAAGVKTTDSDTTYDFWSVGGKYSNGPLNIGAVYSAQEGDADNGSVSSSTNYQKDTYGIYANYDFKVAKVFFSYANREIDAYSKSVAGVKSPNLNGEYEAYDIGVKIPFAQRFTFSATYGIGDFDGKDKVDNSKASFDVDAYQLALTYDFSKRTSVTGYYANTEWDGKGSNSYEADIFGFGLRHQF